MVRNLSRVVALVVGVASFGALSGAPASAATKAAVPSVLTCAGKVVVKPTGYVLASVFHA